MQKVGIVHALFISQKEIAAPITKEYIDVDLQGILDDKHYGSAPERTILITSLESYALAQKELGVKMPYGYLGENLLIDYNPYHLELGTQLRVGSAILEITQNCTLCNHLAALDKRIPKLLRKDRGIFAKVVQEGQIKIDDPVYLI